VFPPGIENILVRCICAHRDQLTFIRIIFDLPGKRLKSFPLVIIFAINSFFTSRGEIQSDSGDPLLPWCNVWWFGPSWRFGFFSSKMRLPAYHPLVPLGVGSPPVKGGERVGSRAL